MILIFCFVYHNFYHNHDRIFKLLFIPETLWFWIHINVETLEKHIYLLLLLLVYYLICWALLSLSIAGIYVSVILQTYIKRSEETMCGHTLQTKRILISVHSVNRLTLISRHVTVFLPVTCNILVAGENKCNQVHPV